MRRYPKTELLQNESIVSPSRLSKIALTLLRYSLDVWVKLDSGPNSRSNFSLDTCLMIGSVASLSGRWVEHFSRTNLAMTVVRPPFSALALTVT
jgi:hypothetical protein